MFINGNRRGILRLESKLGQTISFILVNMRGKVHSAAKAFLRIPKLLISNVDWHCMVFGRSGENTMYFHALASVDNFLRLS